jgi:hypothetical protein
MAYSVDNFVSLPIPGQPLEPAIRIYDINGNFTFAIEPYIAVFSQKNRYVYIILQNNLVYQNTLDFSCDNEAVAALAKLNEIKKIYANSQSPVGLVREVISNYNMPTNITTSASTRACNTPIMNSVVANSLVRVIVSGLEVSVGSGVNYDCYFSPDNLNIRLKGQAQIGDYCYWNYVNGLPVAEYDLDTLDTISFEYLTSDK